MLPIILLRQIKYILKACIVILDNTGEVILKNPVYSTTLGVPYTQMGIWGPHKNLNSEKFWPD